MGEYTREELGRYTEEELRLLGCSPIREELSPNGNTRFVNGKKAWGKAITRKGKEIERQIWKKRNFIDDEEDAVRRKGPTKLKSVIVSDNLQGGQDSSSMGYPPPGFENVQVGRAQIQAYQGQNSNAIRVKAKVFSTAFVCNIPPNVDIRWMENIFGSSPGYCKALVAQRPNKRGRCYGFVYYNTQADLQGAIQKFNGFMLWNYKLFVTKAWERSSNKRSNAFSEDKDGLSYEDFIHRGSIVTSQARLLQRAHLAIAHLNLSVEAIMKEISLQGVYDVQLKSLGNKAVLVYCPDEDFDKELFKEESNWLKSWLTILPGFENLCAKGGKFAWVAIHGMPLKGWCEESFQAALADYGTLVYTHPVTKGGTYVDIAYVMIHTHKLFAFSEEAQIRLGKDQYKVWINTLDLQSIPLFPALDTEANHSNSSSHSDNPSDQSSGDLVSSEIGTILSEENSTEKSKELEAEEEGDFYRGHDVHPHHLLDSTDQETHLLVPAENIPAPIQHSIVQGNEIALIAAQEIVPLLITNNQITPSSKEDMVVRDTFESDNIFISQRKEQEMAEPISTVVVLSNDHTQIQIAPTLTQNLQLQSPINSKEIPSIEEAVPPSLINPEGNAIILGPTTNLLSTILKESTIAAGQLNEGEAQETPYSSPYLSSAKTLIASDNQRDIGLFQAQSEDFLGLDTLNSGTSFVGPQYSALQIELEQTQVNEVADFLGLTKSTPFLKTKFSSKKKKPLRASSPHTYSTRSKDKEAVIPYKSIKKASFLEEKSIAEKAWGFGKAIGLKARVSDQAIYNQLNALDDLKNISIDFEGGSEDDFDDLDRDSDSEKLLDKESNILSSN